MSRAIAFFMLLSLVAEAKHKHHRPRVRPVIESAPVEVASAEPVVVEPPGPAIVAPQTVEIVVVAPPRKLKHQAFDLAVGAGVLMRELSFNDDLFSRLHGYRIDAAPSVDAGLTWYPGAHFTRGAGAHFGISVRGRFVGVTQSSHDGKNHPTRAYSVAAELLGRIPTRIVQPEIAVGYGRQAFEISGNAPVPSVTQDFLRFALGLRARVGRFELAAHGAYRLILSAGELSAWFPRAHLDAVDVDASVGLRMWRGLSLRAGFEFERAFASLNPKPGDPLVAGGAVDQSIGGTLQLAYTF